MLWGRKREKAHVLNDNTFHEHLESHTLVYVFFEAPWCQACKILHPILDDLADEYREQPVEISVVNVDANKELSLKYKIKSLPTLVIFHNKNIVFQGSGMIPKLRLKEYIDKHIVSFTKKQE